MAKLATAARARTRRTRAYVEAEMQGGSRWGLREQRTRYDCGEKSLLSEEAYELGEATHKASWFVDLRWFQPHGRG